MVKMLLYACGIVGKQDGLILAEEEEERSLKRNTNTWARIYI